MSAPPFLVTFFADVWAKFKQEQTLSKADLAHLIESENAQSKSLLRLLKLAKFGNLTSGKKNDCLRSDANMQWISGVEVDYDGEEIPFDDCVQTLDDANLDYIAYTTPSHQRDKPRWRILFPLAERAHVSERDRLVARVNGLFNGKLGPESWTKSQSFYFGYIVNGDGTPARDFRVVCGDGDTLDEAISLDDTAVFQKHKTRDDFTGEYEYVDLAALIRIMTSGGDFHPLLPPIIGSYAAHGMSRADCLSTMRGVFEAATLQRPDLQGRWREVEEVIDYVYRKEQEKRGQQQKPNNGAETQQPKGFFKSSAEFVADFVPPNYLVKKVLIQSYLYALTGMTGSGKTAILLLLAASVALGREFAKLKTKPKRVLYLAAENPDDVRNRWIALAQQMDFDAETIPVWFITSIFNIAQMKTSIRTECERVGGDFGLVIIDTGPAFFQGEDSNDRVEMLRHARVMRDLIEVVPGRPVVLAAMHPPKNATIETLIPAGGGSFLNEIDGNLTTAKTEAAVVLHWQGKFRGAEFNPLNFELATVTHERLVDDDGDLVPTVIARHITETAKEDIKRAAKADWKIILGLMQQNPDVGYGGIAQVLGWLDRDSEPQRWKAQRATAAMTKAKLIKRDAFDKWELTPEGTKVLGDFQGGPREV